MAILIEWRAGRHWNDTDLTVLQDYLSPSYLPSLLQSPTFGDCTQPPPWRAERAAPKTGYPDNVNASFRSSLYIAGPYSFSIGRW